MAEPPAGAAVSNRLPRRAGGQDPRRPGGPELRLLRRDRRQPAGRARRARDLVPKDRGREVLDAGADRAQAARCRRRADLLCRRADRVPRGDRGDVPSLDRPDVFGASGPLVAEVRLLQGPQEDASRSPPTSDGSTPRSTRTTPRTSCRRSPRNGTAATRRSAKAGSSAGNRSPPSWPTPRTSAA